MFYENSELWHLTVNFDKTKIMVFGTRQDQRFDFNLGGHKIDIGTDFKYIGVILAETCTSTKQRKLMVNKLGKQCMYSLNDFEILIFQLICCCFYLTMLSYLLHNMVMRYGA